MDVGIDSLKVHVTSGDRETVSCYEQARAWNNSLVDGIPDCDVGEACTLTINVTQRRESSFQILPCGCDTLHRSKCLRLGDDWRNGSLVFRL